MVEERWGAALVTLACACAAGMAAFIGGSGIAHIDWRAPVAGGAALAVVTLLVARRRLRSLRAFQAACWLLAGCWVAECYRVGTLHAALWSAWVIGTVVAMLVAHAVDPAPAPPAATPAALAEQATDGGLAGWAQRLAAVTDVKHPAVTAITPWPGGTGYDVDGHSTGGTGTGWRDLKRYEEQLANSLGLPHGCGAEVQPGPWRGAWRIRVGTVDTLAAPRTYTDTSPLTINGPLPLGWLRDGTPVEVMLRRECMAVTAKTDGGKTNLLHTTVAGLVRCPDALVWVIDLAGGGLALPWLATWLDSQDGRPALDWAATTVDEAKLMTEMALQVIVERRRAYHPLMRAHDTDIVPMSAAVPQVVIVLDESAEASGDNADATLRANLVRIIQMGRTTGIRVVMSTLRFTGTALPTDAQAQIGPRVLFGVADEAEVGYALGWRVRLDPTAAAHPGCGWIRPSVAAPIEVFRSLHTSPPRVIDRIALECAERRPALDAVSAGVPLGRLYAERWTRTVPQLTGETVPVPVPRQSHETGAATAPTRPAGTVSGMDLDRWTAETRDARRKLAVEGTDARFAELAEQLEPPGDPEAEALRAMAAERSPRARMLAILDEAGPAGLSGPKVHAALEAEGHTVALRTVYRWLKEDAHDGGYGEFVHLRHKRSGQDL